MRRLIIAASIALAGLLLSPVHGAHAVILDFEMFQAGHVLTDADLPPGMTVSTINSAPGHPDKAIIFESNCPMGCSGGDFDLRTPGAGIGNDTPQGKLLIIAEDDVDANNDGLVDDPDDEEAGGTITFTFDPPRKLISVRVIDIEDMDEFPSGLVLELTAGGTQEVLFAELGNNSAQTVQVPNPQPADAVTFVLESTGAIDDVNVVLACGDGIVDPGEECDPPNGTTCDDDCMIIDGGGVCGDGVQDPGEECDDGPDNSDTEPNACRIDCTLPVCGDGVIDDQLGEECDPPNGTTCDSECKTIAPPSCGDGIQDPGEECDDGSGNSDTTPDACRTDCTLPVCGDDVVDSGEQCDPPNGTTCDDQCQTIPDDCGNGSLDPGEECDPPADSACPGECRTDCSCQVCGDGIQDPGEECDDGAGNSDTMPDACRTDCTLPICGDDVVDTGEECDPPDGTTCDDGCQTIVPPACGDGTLDPGEECDPPDDSACPGGCRVDCTCGVCGDGILDGNEECDEGTGNSDTDPNACRTDCTLPVCGDDVLDDAFGEECDPPDGLTCSDACESLIPDGCGDGVLDPGEECDPPEDGACEGECRANCSCPVCGDGFLDPDEECDDGAGNSDTDPNACRPDCTLPICGDGVVDDQLGEECDPPAVQGGASECHADCTIGPICGNDVVDPGEECDPPAVLGGAPDCHPDCMFGPVCGNMNIDPGEACDPPSPPLPDSDEICDNTVDDDDNGLIDCADPGCAPDDQSMFCSSECLPGMCLPILRDPAIVKFITPHNFFSIHGRVNAAPDAFDPTTVDFRIILANQFGEVLNVVVEGNRLAPSGRRRWFFKNKSAKFEGEAADGGGVFRASFRFRRVQGTESYTFKLRIYGDFSEADPIATGTSAEELKHMQTLVYGVGDGVVGFLSKDWKRTKRGWQLRLSAF